MVFHPKPQGGSAQGATRPRDVVRQYDGLLGSTRELRSTAANLGGSAGELLLDFCTAGVSRALVQARMSGRLLTCPAGWHHAQGAPCSTCMQACMAQGWLLGGAECSMRWVPLSSGWSNCFLVEALSSSGRPSPVAGQVQSWCHPPCLQTQSRSQQRLWWKEMTLKLRVIKAGLCCHPEERGLPGADGSRSVAAWPQHSCVHSQLPAWSMPRIPGATARLMRAPPVVQAAQWQALRGFFVAQAHLEASNAQGAYALLSRVRERAAEVGSDVPACLCFT